MTLERTAPARFDAGRFVLPLGAHALVVTPWSEAILEFRFEGPQPLPVSPAALPARGGALSVDETATGYRIGLPGVVLVLEASPLTLRFETPAGELLWGPAGVRLSGDRLELYGALAPDDAFYGLGEKPGYLNKRGRAYGMWNTDNTGPHVETADLMYQSIPWLITRTGGRSCGLLFDDPGHTHLDLGAEDARAWRFAADGPVLRLYAVAGPRLADVVKRYGELTGRMALPPRWALGYHQSRWSYPTRGEVLHVATELRDRRLPADVIHLDIDYMEGYRVFTWSRERFPEPAELLGMLREQGFRVVTIVDPGVKQDPHYDVCRELEEKGLAVRMPHGSPYVGDVWPGPCYFPDFLKPETRRWWGDRHTAYTEPGVAGIWNDMNEPSVFHGPGVPRPDQTMPADATFGPADAPVPHAKAHNLYGFHMSQATHEALLRLLPDQRPFVISRAGYAGIQRHAMVWLGDNHSIWAHLEQGLPMGLNMGLSGVPFVGPDSGGFMGDCSPELLQRWMQAGIFTPFFRNHSAQGTRRQEPWAFGADTEAICRDALEWRYRLLPYLYTVFREAAETGLPMQRPLVLTHEEDAETANLYDQFFFGDALLVAPILKPGATHRMVYFPAGRWLDFHSQEVFTGPGYQVVPAGPDRIPVFAREGALVPLGPVVQHTGEPLEVLTLEVFEGPHLAGVFYDDDGETLAYTRGGYNLWQFSGTWDAQAIVIRVTPEHLGYESPTQILRLSLPLESIPRARYAGVEVEVWKEGDRVLLEIPLRAGEVRITL
ncbi:MAG TPA: TIM-barrel domain-containing protein [Oscillatoriaceae cyanobacterium]